MSSSLENTLIFLGFITTDASIPDLRQKEEDNNLLKCIWKVNSFLKYKLYLLLTMKYKNILETSILPCNN